MSERLQDLQAHGQSIWYDNIRRALLDSGELRALLDSGVTGVTSNPSIFEKAIAGSTDYDGALHRWVDEGKSDALIYETLVLEDIQRTADLLRPVYDRSEGLDGYVSLEVSPKLAHDSEGTIAEARRLFAVLDRPNVMIKVPATDAGIPAIEALIAEGINVNVTLIFSSYQYESVAAAYITGLHKRALEGGDVSRVASVASFFVSHVDSKIDLLLEEIGSQTALALRGRIAIANAKLAYALFREFFSGAEWENLEARGARVQRPLWASTSTKNAAYPDTMYVDQLIGPDTVNTVPPTTLKAFIDHGRIASTLQGDPGEEREQLDKLEGLGINFAQVTRELQDEGVAAFAQSFESLMQSIAQKRERLHAGWQHRIASLGVYEKTVETALTEMAAQRILPRIWNRDYSVWKKTPDEITNRLGWLHIAETMSAEVERMQTFVDAVKADGFTHVLLLGMGGSSLAPEVFQKTFQRDDHLTLSVLDSTDPAAVLAQVEQIDLAHTLFVVSTKSGGTVETFSFFKFFYNRVSKAIGAEQAGRHFVAITDPGSGLVDTANKYHFRATFLNDPNIGGRYSALSFFGLVPAALVGVDVPKLLNRALAMASGCDSCVSINDNDGAWLGAVLGELARIGRDKLTIVASPPVASFGDWVEQLIAESTGKEATGIVPVVGEALGAPDVYSSDRLFMYLHLEGDDTYDAPLAALRHAGQPVVELLLHDAYDLGGQFFLWEIATALAGYRLGINPFDQPNVESAKVRAREMVAAYQKEGKLPAPDPLLRANDITVYGDVKADDAVGALLAFLDQAKPGDYVTLQAYVQPASETTRMLQELRHAIRDRLMAATTLGYGPRFLHSTGQLHKGDAGNGLFIQLTSAHPNDVAIPDEAGADASSITFGVLIDAQALGDRQALLDNHRRVVRFDLEMDVRGGIKKLGEAYSM